MTDENNKALDVLVSKIAALVNAGNERLGYDKTFKATIWGKNADGTYQITYCGQKYDISSALEAELSPGESVWVKIPGGIFRHMHICGINRRKTNAHN